MLDAAVLLDRSPVRHGTFYFQLEWFLLTRREMFLVFVVAASLRLGLGFNGRVRALIYIANYVKPSSVNSEP